MRESLGSAFMYNIIIIFLLVVFAMISGTLSYYKAFKVNTFITDAIEKFEGYNHLSVAEIDRSLRTIGYSLDPSFKCPRRRGVEPITKPSGVNHRYCVYLYDEGLGYRTYGVVSYINLDIPVIGQLVRVPIYSQTLRLYDFK
jgi:hypothetical protein